MPTLSAWRTRDTLAALALFLASAAFTLWQNAHLGVLWDLAYLLDSSLRISLGQVPYRDFPFAHAPLTFLIQAAVVRLFGRVYWRTIAYAAFANGLATLLTWRIALRILPHRWLLLTLLCTTLVPLGIYSIYPHPIYDSDCILSVLLALYLILGAPFLSSLTAHERDANANPNDSPTWSPFLAGTASILPLFFKQNIGLLFLATTLACMVAITITRKLHREPITPQLAFFTGATLTLAAALLALHLTVGLHNYLYWTITFAAQRRLPGLSLILGTYHQASLLWTIPTSLAALALLSKEASSRPERAARIGETYIGNHLKFFISTGAQRSGETRIVNHPRSVISTVAPPRFFISTGAQRSGETRIVNPRRSFISTAAQRIVETPVFAIGAATTLAAPFLYAAITFFLADDPSDRTDALLSLWPHLLVLAILFALTQLRLRPTLTTLLPIILLATVHGTFLSQQLWGSTYALWPLLVLLLALMLPCLRTLTTPITLLITAVFLVCGSLYALGHDRLSYSHIDPIADGPIAHATLPALRGLSTPGPYLPAFEQLLRFTDATIPANDGILLLPGQDPFYFASGRTPRFPVLLIDPATNPYTPAQLALEALHRNIRWLIVNKNLQLTADPVGNLSDYLRSLEAVGYVPVQSLDNYTVYELKPNIYR